MPLKCNVWVGSNGLIDVGGASELWDNEPGSETQDSGSWVPGFVLRKPHSFSFKHIHTLDNSPLKCSVWIGSDGSIGEGGASELWDDIPGKKRSWTSRVMQFVESASFNVFIVCVMLVQVSPLRSACKILRTCI